MAFIELHTAQNVVIEYELASLRDRILAYLFDILLFGSIIFLSLMVGSNWIVVLIDQLGFGVWTFLTLLPYFGLLLYHFLFEIIGSGRSPGKIFFRLQVVRIDGHTPRVIDSFLRSSFQILDCILSVGVLASLLISTSDKKQRLGDLAANTTVVKIGGKKSFELENIMQLDIPESYHPQYPEVLRLEEKDILLIKEVVRRYENYANKGHLNAVQQMVRSIEFSAGIKYTGDDPIEFLKKLMKDYIVLSR